MDHSGFSEYIAPRRFETDRTTPLRWLVSHTLRHGWVFLALFLGALGNAATAALVPLLVGAAFNSILLNPPQTAALLPIALQLLASQVARGVLQLIRNAGAEFIAQRIERDIRDELFSSLLGKSMTFHGLQPVGDTMARATNDVREINFLFSPGVNLVIGSLTFLAMPIILAPRLHPLLIITPVLFLVLYVLILVDYLRTLRPITDNVRSSFGDLNSRLAETLDGIETVKSAAQEDYETQGFSDNAGRFRLAAVRQGEVEARFIPLLLYGITLAGGLFHALLLFQQGYLDVGQVVSYFGLLLLLEFPTFISFYAYAQISLGLAGAKRVLELIQRENTLDQNKEGYSQVICGDVDFKQVTFTYPDSEENITNGPVLKDISFSVKAGQTVAIVGQTGAGKTSLTRLINRTFDVSSGKVLVDGIDVRDWNLEALRRGISIIEQDIFLFSRSIAENIAFGRPDATQEEIERVARAAQAHEFILAMNEGYQTVIGERGVTLSGGQRQRLALARALLTDPPILILDDSTSAIDSATEDLIQQAIFTAARGRTTFIITHRLSQIRWADLILVLRKGKLVAAGDHATLMETSSAYRKIFQE